MTKKVEAVLRGLGVEGRRRGQRVWARCPVHEEKSASWFIRLDGARAGQHHCFACKFGGTLTALVAEVRGCDQTDANDWIRSATAGLHDREPVVSVSLKVSPLTRRVFELPREVSILPLREWHDIARRYAIERGITAAQVDEHGLGVALDGRLAARIIFPVRDLDFVPIGYSARSFAGDEPRYLTPHEMERADLGGIFGEHAWPPSIDLRSTVYVEEGAINALAVESAAKEPVFFGSLGGSELHPMQASKLATFKRVVIVSDPDIAGDKLAHQIESALARHTVVDRVRLPAKADPQSIGPAELRRRLWGDGEGATP